ncbi:uncharacterized protein PSFLO_01446 [Pseudozyma flocculosa]|uniref:Uncharacterized protein n=1 Tax=Pseudozyma flocculosa TaxID=84751 RepID=A0A5C3EW37_9BASI|nr:uncharacterized protein PSFLO_01446 [Pseudozyma flocculosa]
MASCSAEWRLRCEPSALLRSAHGPSMTCDKQCTSSDLREALSGAPLKDCQCQPRPTYEGLRASRELISKYGRCHPRRQVHTTLRYGTCLRWSMPTCRPFGLRSASLPKRRETRSFLPIRRSVPVRTAPSDRLVGAGPVVRDEGGSIRGCPASANANYLARLACLLELQPVRRRSPHEIGSAPGYLQ